MSFILTLIFWEIKLTNALNFQKFGLASLIKHTECISNLYCRNIGEMSYNLEMKLISSFLLDIYHVLSDPTASSCENYYTFVWFLRTSRWRESPPAMTDGRSSWTASASARRGAVWTLICVESAVLDSTLAMIVDMKLLFTELCHTECWNTALLLVFCWFSIIYAACSVMLPRGKGQLIVGAIQSPLQTRPLATEIVRRQPD